MFKYLLFTALVSFNLSAFAFLADVQDLNVTQTGKDFAEIQFNAVLDADNYTLLIGTNSVSNDGESYNLPPVIMGNNTQYRVSNLKEDTTYFMRVFASNDSDKSENLSNEISVNLSELGQNLLPSQIQAIEVLDSRNIQISFEKEMQFDDQTKESIRMFKNFDGNEFFIQSIEILDEKNIKLFLADNLDANFDYDIHILPSLVDIDANPLDADKLVIKLTTEEDITEYVDLTNLPDLKIISAVAFDQSAFEVEFSDPVKRDPELRNQVSIFEKDDSKNTLDVVDVLFNELEPKKLLIVTTEVQEKNYVIEFGEVQSDMGKILAPADSRVEVLNKPTPSTSQIQDALAFPIDIDVEEETVDDITGLSGSVMLEDSSKVELKFDKPTSNKLKEIKVLLESDDGKTYDLIDVISKDLSKVILELGTPVTNEKNIKVIAVDQDGNESMGVITKLLIPETGPAAALATLVGSGLLGAVVSRRRK